MAEKVKFEVVTPAKQFMAAEADMVVVPGGAGHFGVLPGHAPLLSTVNPGVIEIWEKDKVKDKLFVEGGFADVNPERCTVLAETAMHVAEIDRAQAEKRVDAARERLEKAGEGTERKEAGHELAAAEAMLAAAG